MDRKQLSRRIWGILMNPRLTESAVSPCSREGQHPAAWENCFFPSVWHLWDLCVTGLQCPILCSLVQERYWQTGVRPWWTLGGWSTQAMRVSWELDLFCRKKRRWKVDLIFVYRYLTGECWENRARLFLELHSDRTRCNRHKFEHEKIWLDVRISSPPNNGSQILECVTQVLGNIHPWR